MPEKTITITYSVEELQILKSLRHNITQMTSCVDHLIKIIDIHNEKKPFLLLGDTAIIADIENGLRVIKKQIKILEEI